MNMYRYDRRIVPPSHTLILKDLHRLFIKKCKNSDFEILSHHSKNQEKYVLTIGNDVVTPHVWYLTERKVQWDSLRQIIVLVHENAAHDCTNCANHQFVVYYCILHLPTC
jgi:hypothetical protein